MVTAHRSFIAPNVVCAKQHLICAKAVIGYIVVGTGVLDGPFVKQHLICCRGDTVALCMPSLVREGGPLAVDE